MKTLITTCLLMCVMTSYGQGSIRSNVINPDTVRKYAMYEIEITIGLLFEYEKECYADSAYHYYCIGCIVYDYNRTYTEEDYQNYLYAKNNTMLGRSYEIKRIIVHRQPTFDGFLEYLHRKTNVKNE